MSRPAALFPSFETDRLILRPYNPEQDAEMAFEIYGDPVVMTYLGSVLNPPPCPTVGVQRERLIARNEAIATANDGSGFWALERKGTGEIVGTGLLKRTPDGEGSPTEDWEIGWHLKHSAWGNGYATEAARRIMRYAFEDLKLAFLNAVAYKENLASLRVMQRLGMTYIGPTDAYYGVTLELYQSRSTD